MIVKTRSKLETKKSISCKNSKDLTVGEGPPDGLLREGRISRLQSCTSCVSLPTLGTVCPYKDLAQDKFGNSSLIGTMKLREVLKQSLCLGLT